MREREIPMVSTVGLDHMMLMEGARLELFARDRCGVIGAAMRDGNYRVEASIRRMRIVPLIPDLAGAGRRSPGGGD
jgi:hypothetical protein